jgi:hypothetical protein
MPSIGESAIRGLTQGLQGGIQLGMQLNEQKAKVDARLAEIGKEKEVKAQQDFDNKLKLGKMHTDAYNANTEAGREAGIKGTLALYKEMGYEVPEEIDVKGLDFSSPMKELTNALKAYTGSTAVGGDKNLLLASIDKAHQMAANLLPPDRLKSFEARAKTREAGAISEREQSLLGQVARLPGLEEEGFITPKQRSEAEIQGLTEAGKKGEALLTKRLEEQIKQSNKEVKVIDEKTRLDREKSLRVEYVKAAKVFIDVRDSFTRVNVSAKDPSAAGDLALIFNYMKMLDPASVVRESEFATAAATGAWGERLQAAAGKMLRGERLSEVMRADFLDRATKLSKGSVAQHEQRVTTYRRLAKDAKVKPENVAIKLTDPRINEITEISFDDRLGALIAEGKTEEEAFAIMQGENF